MKRFFLLPMLALISFYATADSGLGFFDAGRMAVEASAELRNEFQARALR